MNRAISISIALLVLLSSIISLAQSGYVEYTLVLANNTLIPGNANVSGGGYPLAIAFDTNNSYLYVLGRSTIFIVDPNNNSVIGEIPLQSPSTSIAYVPSNGYIYVATNGSGILVINPSTKGVVDRIPIYGEIWQMVYVPSNGYIYVSVSSSDEVDVIDTLNNTIVTTIKVGPEPIGMAYDPNNSYIYVADYGSGEVSIIDTKNDSLVGNIAIGGFPWGIAYDPNNGYIYVTEYNGMVVAISTVVDDVVANISIGNGIARCLTFDPSNDLIYVTVDNVSGLGNVVVINTTNVIGRIQVGKTPWGITYDPTNGHIYVANTGSGTISIIATQISQLTSSGNATTFVPTPPMSSKISPINTIVLVIIAFVLVVSVLLVFFKKK